MAEIELMATGASALDPALSARLFLAVGELDVVAVVSCARHHEGRDWTINVKRVSCGDEDVSAPDGLRDEIEGWLERERNRAAKPVWEVV